MDDLYKKLGNELTTAAIMLMSPPDYVSSMVGVRLDSDGINRRIWAGDNVRQPPASIEIPAR